MICLSYLEGVEQYKEGRSNNGASRAFFVSAMKKIYPNKFSEEDLKQLYQEARCGLFHSGMVQGRIIINNNFSESITFDRSYDIKINPKKFLRDIKNDFEGYLHILRTNEVAQDLFDRMYSNI